MRQASEREEYLKALFGLNDSTLSQVEERLLADGKWGIQIGAAEAATLMFLIRLIEARKVVEIGSLYGFSTVCLARALKDGGRLWSLEVSPENAAKTQSALRSANCEGKTQVLVGDALETLRSISSAGPFDLVFIDANKLAYPQYFAWAEENVRPGGLIVLDNTLNQPAGSRQESIMKELNQIVAQSGRFNAVVVPTSEGLTVAQKKS